MWVRAEQVADQFANVGFSKSMSCPLPVIVESILPAWQNENSVHRTNGGRRNEQQSKPPIALFNMLGENSSVFGLTYFQPGARRKVEAISSKLPCNVETRDGPLGEST